MTCVTRLSVCVTQPPLAAVEPDVSHPVMFAHHNGSAVIFQPHFLTIKKAPRFEVLYYQKMVVEDGFEPSKSVTADLQSAPFGRSGIPPQRLERVGGVEPP